jgi:precorrin-6B methylase 2
MRAETEVDVAVIESSQDGDSTPVLRRAAYPASPMFTSPAGQPHTGAARRGVLGCVTDVSLVVASLPPVTGVEPSAGALAWRWPTVYELYFAASPAAAVLRAREIEAVLSALAVVGAPSDRILEMGAGPGTYTRRIAARCREVVAVDSSTHMLRRLERNMARAGIRNVAARWGRMPDVMEQAGRFDGVVAAGVLDYASDLVAALASLRTSVCPGGWVVFTAPRARSLPRLASLVEGKVVRRSHPRRPDELRRAAASAGLALHAVEEVALGGIGRTLVARAVAPQLDPAESAPSPT